MPFFLHIQKPIIIRSNQIFVHPVGPAHSPTQAFLIQPPPGPTAARPGGWRSVLVPRHCRTEPSRRHAWTTTRAAPPPTPTAAAEVSTWCAQAAKSATTSAAAPGRRGRVWRRRHHLGAVGRCIQGVRRYVGAPGDRGTRCCGEREAFWWWR